MKKRYGLAALLAAALLILAACAINVANIRPVASFIANPTSGTSPLNVDFDASASHDPDGTITAYAWLFGDGQSASSVVPLTHQYTVQTDPQTFTVVLTVTDNVGATDVAFRTITVNP